MPSAVTRKTRVRRTLFMGPHRKLGIVATGYRCPLLFACLRPPRSRLVNAIELLDVRRSKRYGIDARARTGLRGWSWALRLESVVGAEWCGFPILTTDPESRHRLITALASRVVARVFVSRLILGGPDAGRRRSPMKARRASQIGDPVWPINVQSSSEIWGVASARHPRPRRRRSLTSAERRFSRY
jgi:hypothetical protein